VPGHLTTTLASALLAASAGIILALGLLHLLYTFRGRMLRPRDAQLEQRMREVSPVITRETTMWNAWVVAFARVAGRLRVARQAVLVQRPVSWHLAGYRALCRRHPRPLGLVRSSSPRC
jgi:hypothetical protein